jgi:predicted O-methyltransferase YrrM
MEKSNAEEILREVEGLRDERFLPIVGPEKGEVLIDVIHEHNPRRILEVGTLIGYSAILMGKELDEEGEIVTIEIHEDEIEEAKKNVERANIPPEVSFILGDALEVIPDLEGEFDLVFIDASKEEYLRYLQLAEPRLHKGSVVVADNAGIFAEQMDDISPI